MKLIEVDVIFIQAFTCAKQSFLKDATGRRIFSHVRLELDSALLGLPARASVSFDLEVPNHAITDKSMLHFYGSCSVRIECSSSPVFCEKGWTQAESIISFSCTRNAPVLTRAGRDAFENALSKAIALLPSSESYRAARESFDIGQAISTPSSSPGLRL